MVHTGAAGSGGMWAGASGVGGIAQQQPAEEPLFMAIPMKYYLGYCAFFLPMTVWGTNAWNAFVRAVSRPAPASATTADIVLGSPLVHIREEMAITKRNPLRFCLSYLADLLEGCSLLPSYMIASFIDVGLARMRNQPEPTSATPLSLTWGCALGSLFTFPFSILSYQVKTNSWQGWQHLLPVTTLGRYYWRALPVKMLDSLTTWIVQDYVKESMGRRLNVSTELLGWLAPEPKEDDFEEDDSTLQTVIHRLHLWSRSALANLSGLLCGAVLQMPLFMVYYRMMANPGHFSSGLACARHIWATEGLGGFYRELPLYLGIMAITVI